MKYTDDKLREVYKYLNTIRNGYKKTYGNDYLMYILNPSDNHEPIMNGLSYMAKQAVRMNINKILNES